MSDVKTPFDELSFLESECHIDLPVNTKSTGTSAPIRVGVRNGLSEEAMQRGNLVRVVHVPTGFHEEESRWTIYHNKQIALSRLKVRVEAFIKEKREEYLRSVGDHA